MLGDELNLSGEQDSVYRQSSIAGNGASGGVADDDTELGAIVGQNHWGSGITGPVGPADGHIILAPLIEWRRSSVGQHREGRCFICQSGLVLWLGYDHRQGGAGHEDIRGAESIVGGTGGVIQEREH